MTAKKIFLKTIWQKLKPSLLCFHKFRKQLWKKYQINKIILLLSLTIMLLASVYLFYLAKTADVGTLKSSLSTSTMIYDENGQEAGLLFGQKGTFVQISDISKNVQEAVVAVEDRTFYENHGISPQGIMRALFLRLLHGEIRGGGSTITQQLAKNAYLTQRQTWDRKARELFLALEINKKYSKQDILTMYLNNAYFGNGVWGIEDAAHKYFGRAARDLDVCESAIIAGMLKGPEIYNPINYPENAKNRRDTVLQVMAEQKKISQREADKQARVPIASMLRDDYLATKGSYKYPSFFDAVLSEAEQKAKISDKNILTKGYKIYTTLNQKYQSTLQDIYGNLNNFPQAADGSFAKSAAVVMDPATGDVQGLIGEVGNPEKHIFRQFNYATQTLRPPGSAIKPLVVYAPAIKRGYKINEKLLDSTEALRDIALMPGFDGADKVSNYGNHFSGQVPMYQALAQSLNVPAVYLESKIGLENAFEMGQKFGLPLQDEDQYYGLALGGLAHGFSPWVMTQAYGTFGNGGEMIEAHLIKKIVDSTGAVVYEANPTVKSVVSKRVARSMTSMMLGTFSNGTGILAAPANFRMAGKTGTTETDFDANKTKDQWVVGFNPDVTITTWLGFEKTDREHFLVDNSPEQSTTIFRKIANRIMPLTSGKTFDELYPGIKNAYQTGGADSSATAEEEATDKIAEFKKKACDVWRKTKEKTGNFDVFLDKIKGGVGKVWDGIKNFVK